MVESPQPSRRRKLLAKAEPLDRRATIRDVAAMANVSIGTVSRVVTGAAHVSDELRERVLEAAETLRFRPRSRAPSAAASPVRLIGFFVTDLSNLLYGSVVSAAEERLAQLGYTLVVANTRNESRRESELLSLLGERIMEGAIVSFGEESRPGLGAALKKLAVPVVVLDRNPPKRVDSVLVDHRGGTASAARYLIGLGHRRIALHDRKRPHPAGAGAHRRAEGGLCGSGLELRRILRGADRMRDGGSRVGRDGDADGRAGAADRLLTLGSQALSGTLRAVKAAGLAVPRDVSVICFGDTEMAKVVEPPITCVHWDRGHLGRQAVELLVQRIENRIDREPRTVVLPTEIVLRQSCAAAPRR